MIRKPRPLVAALQLSWELCIETFDHADMRCAGNGDRLRREARRESPKRSAATRTGQNTTRQAARDANSAGSGRPEADRLPGSTECRNAGEEPRVCREGGGPTAGTRPAGNGNPRSGRQGYQPAGRIARRRERPERLPRKRHQPTGGHEIDGTLPGRHGGGGHQRTERHAA